MVGGRGFDKDAARAILIRATVLEFSRRLPCPVARARIVARIDQLVPRMTERTGGIYSSI